MSSWSARNPRLQVAWDATSWAALQKCPRFYQLSIMEGWRQPENPHLDFGSMFQEGVEVFQLARLRGAGIEEAAIEGLERLIQISGWYAPVQDHGYTWHPWGGEYLDQWRCAGTEPYKNEKGNRAKCPFSHAGKWFDDDPVWCHACGSNTETARNYLPDHPSKHRLNLVRAFVMFADYQSETQGLQPYKFPDGTPAVELTIEMPLGRKTPGTRVWAEEPDYDQHGEITDHQSWDCGDGEDYTVVVNLDEIDEWRGNYYPTDQKTTKNPLNDTFFRSFAPNPQFDLYDLVSSIALPDLDIGGCAIRGIQVTKETVDVKTMLLTKSEGQREETLHDLHYWIGQAEKFAADNYWPMNRASCKGCDFAGICDLDPEWRERKMLEYFTLRGSWDPLSRPGRAAAEEDTP